jgi:hypothetical protein
MPADLAPGVRLSVRSLVILCGVASLNNRRGAQLQGTLTTVQGMEPHKTRTVPRKCLTAICVLGDKILSVHSISNPWLYIVVKEFDIICLKAQFRKAKKKNTDVTVDMAV